MLRTSAAIALSGLCLLFSSCDQAQKKQKEKEAMRDLSTSKNEMLDSMEMTDEGLVVDTEKMKEAQQRLKASGEKLGGKVGEALKIAADLQISLGEEGEKCAKAGEEVGPYLDMESLSASRDYAGGIVKFKQLITTNEATLAAFRSYEPELYKRLNEIGFSGAERDGFDAGFKRKWKKTSELVEIIRNADLELAKIGIALREGLEKGDSQWKWDADEEQVTFQNDDQAEWFNAHMKRIQEVGEKQAKAQEDLLAHMKSA